MHLHDASLGTRCCESHQACCALPVSQCAAHCYSCNKAGAGKCDTDKCDDGYGPTKSGTCAPVRLLPAWALRLARVQEAPLCLCC